MRVAIVAPEDLPVPPARGGSVQIYLHALCAAFPAQGTDLITLFSPGAAEASYSAAAHERIRGDRQTYRRGVLKRLRQLQPDVIQIDNRPDFVPLVRRAVPRAKIVLNLHSINFLSPRRISPSASRRVLTSADAVVCNSRYLRRQVAIRFGLRQQSWSPHVIYPGVDLSAYQPRDHNIRPKRSTGRLRVLYVGRVIRQKGVHVLVKAIRRVHTQGHPVKLTVIGRTPPWEGGYAVQLQKLARGLPVRFLGFVPPSELPRYYRRADVFVCPSQEREAFGMVNVEALASGLPVIASRHGGIPEIVNNDCGQLIRSFRQPKAFATALRAVANDQYLLVSLREGAKKRAARFTWNRTASKFIALYDSLC